MGLRHSHRLIHVGDPSAVVVLNPEILFLKRKDVRCLPRLPVVWCVDIWHTGYDTLAIAGTNTVAKLVLTAGDTMRDNSVNPRLVAQANFT